MAMQRSFWDSRCRATAGDVAICLETADWNLCSMHMASSLVDPPTDTDRDSMGALEPCVSFAKHEVAPQLGPVEALSSGK